MRTDVLIVGGGLAGLACAMALRDSGLVVTLVEAGAQLGGRASSTRDAVTGDVVDIGPHVITSHHCNDLDLLAQCGTRDLVRWQPRPLITLFDGREAIDAQLAPLPAPFALAPTFARIHQLSLRARLSNARPTWAAMRFTEDDVAVLDRQDAASYLRAAGVDASFIDWFWRSVCMTVLNVPLERCSAAALLRAYAQLCGHTHFAFGFPSVGLNELVEPPVMRLLDAAGVRIHSGAVVAQLLFEQQRCAGAVLDDGTRVAARHVVCALPPAEAAGLLAGRLALPAYTPSEYRCLYLWFERRLTRMRFWTRVWAPDTVNFDFYDLANIRDWPAQRGSLIASNVVHSQRLPAMDDAQLIDVTLRELREFAPAARGINPTHARVHHVPMAVPCPEPGTEARRPHATSDLTPGLALAGDWTRTELPASMESAVRSGRLAAEAVLRACGRPRPLAIPPPATTGFAGFIRRTHERRRSAQRRDVRLRDARS